MNKEERKAQVLLAISNFTNEHGYPPSYRDLEIAVGIAHSAIWHVVESLRTDGLIHEREAKHSRAITLTDAGRAATGRAGTFSSPYPGA
jgi:SOS-response transcriptional repressor LexA